MTPVADVSVVVASFSGEAALARCLESLDAQTTGCEVIASTDLEGEALARLSARFPRARVLTAAPGTSAFRLRSLGVVEARGRLIALTEDHCTAAPGWLAALSAAHAAGHAVVGGVVENGRAAGAYERALYWCEYAAQMPPLPEGPSAFLSGVNVAYDRDVLLALRHVWQEVFYESEVHAALRAAGQRLHRAPSAVVTSHLDFAFGEALAHLRRGGRRYGRERIARSGPAQRALLCLGVPAVPALLLWRVVAAVVSRRPRELGHLLLALPHAACLVTAWGAGEALGYWGGILRAPVAD